MNNDRFSEIDACVCDHRICTDMLGDDEVCGDYRLKRYILAKPENQSQPEQLDLKDIEFGSEIEIYENKWNTVKWAGFQLGNNAPLVVRDNMVFAISGMKWRLPLEQRMQRGQPVVCGGNRMLRFFSYFEKGKIVTMNCVGEYNSWEFWRLPTKKELESIGHDNGQWLAKEDV